MDVEHGDRDAQARAGTAVRLFEVGAPRLLEPLDAARRVGQADFGELRVDVAPAALEDAEDIAGRQHAPARQRIHFRERAALFLFVGQYLVETEARLARFLIFLGGQPRRGRKDARGFAGARISLAEHIVFIRDDAIVVRRATPQHRAGRHHRAFGRLDHFEMARTARLARDAIVAGVYEADEFGRFLVEQGIAPLGIRRTVVPRAGQRRLRVRELHHRLVRRMLVAKAGCPALAGVAAVAVGAAELHRGGCVHRRLVGARVARIAAVRFRRDLGVALLARRGRGEAIFDLDRLFLLGRTADLCADCQRRQNEGEEKEKSASHPVSPSEDEGPGRAKSRPASWRILASLEWAPRLRSGIREG